MTSVWWTYRLDDFLLFSPQTYQRLFELHNGAWWPAQPLALALGAAGLWAAWRWRDASRAGGAGGAGGALDAPVALGAAVADDAHGASAARAAAALLGAAWGFVAWAWHLERFATIQWAAPWFAAAFAVQGLLLLGWALRPGSASPRAAGTMLAPRAAALRARRVADAIGLALAMAGLLGWPALPLLQGRPGAQAEWFALMPDPTVLFTLGWLLLRAAPAWLWPLPLAWCAVAGATLWPMQAPHALWLPALGGVAGAAALGAMLSARRDRASQAAP